MQGSTLSIGISLSTKQGAIILSEEAGEAAVNPDDSPMLNPDASTAYNPED